MHIDAPGTEVHCIVVGEDFEVKMTPDTRIRQFSLYDIDVAFDGMDIDLTEYGFVQRLQ